MEAASVFFIKLGRSGDWDAQCLQEGILRLGYRKIPADILERADWPGVQAFCQKERSSGGAATRDLSQIRAFYEADESTIFLTFVLGLMYWCRPSGRPWRLGDGSHCRRTTDGWHSTSRNGTPLTVDQLSGNLAKVQMFRGTICSVADSDYVVRKIADQPSPVAQAADEAERAMHDASLRMMRELSPPDFEMLVGFVFQGSGWRRIGAVGKNQKLVDLDLLQSLTGERAFVQIKSTAQQSDFDAYKFKFSESCAYDKMFFVWHTGNLNDTEDSGTIMIGPDQMPRMVLDAGLFSWLRRKVA